VVSLESGSCNLRAVLTGGDAGQTTVYAVGYASGLFRAPPFSLVAETRGIDKERAVWKHVISQPVDRVFGHRHRKKAHDAGQVSGISLVRYRDWMGVNLVVRKY
jgi:hypothetical protein